MREPPPPALLGQLAPASPLLRAKPAPSHAPTPALLEAREAALRCACVIAGFFKIMPEELLKPTRGTADEAFARQLLMAGLVVALGIDPALVGEAVGRTKDTVDHAARVMEAMRSGDAKALDDVLGLEAGDEFLGDASPAEFMEHAEALIADLFDAFALVAVQGGAYCRERERRKREKAAR